MWLRRLEFHVHLPLDVSWQSTVPRLTAGTISLSFHDIRAEEQSHLTHCEFSEKGTQLL